MHGEPRICARRRFRPAREKFRANAPRAVYFRETPFPARPGEISGRCTENRKSAPAIFPKTGPLSPRERVWVRENRKSAPAAVSPCPQRI